MSAIHLQPEHSALVVVDVQDRLAAAMPEADRDEAIRNVGNLVEGARLLSVPVLVTEQYPRGLGPTVEPVRARLDAIDPRPPVVEKVEFDACGNPAFLPALRALDRRTVIVTGMEAHVCVFQTARGLGEAGYAVHVPYDATCSRDPRNRRVAEGLWERAGATRTCTETVLFDWLGRAGGDAFKAISRLVR